MKLKEILQAKNVVDLLNDDKLAEIGSQVEKTFNSDLQSRKDKQDKLQDIVKLALSISENKSFPWENASNTIYPLISTAVIDFSAKCSPEILRDDAIVKAKVIGKDEGKIGYTADGNVMINQETGQPEMVGVGNKQRRGDRVATFMNYQLSEEIENWADDTDKLTISLATCGTMFRKTFKGNNGIESELVYPDKLILHDKTTKFSKAPKTHIIELYTNEIQERIRRGIYAEFDYNANNSDSTSSVINNDLSNSQDESSGGDVNSGLHIFLEQCCWLDLDEDDFLEPYAVTIHQKTKEVVRIVPRFEEEDIEKEGKEIIAIKENDPYTPYIFIPSPDGSFYGIGLGHLLFNLNKSVNTSINQLTDAGTLQNTGGGFIAKSLKIRGGSFKMRPNEWKMVDSMGGAIRDSLVPLPTPQPSQTLFALLGFLVQSGKELGSLRDVLNGENAANVQATTMMALVEQGITQFKAIYKRLYRSLKKEFGIIYDINAKYLTNKKYSEILDEPMSDTDVKSDFNKKGFDIIPVADVSSVTNTQKMARASFLMQFLNDPYTDQLLLRQRILSGFNIENYEELITAPPPQTEPDVNTILAQAELTNKETKLKEIEIKTAETLSKLQKSRYDIEQMIADIKVKESQALKNISEAFAKERDMVLKTAEQINNNIQQRVNENQPMDQESSEQEEPQETEQTAEEENS